jgi:hypothetical protein
METQRWNAILSRIARHEADDLDDVAAAFDPRRGAPGRDLFPEIGAVLMPQAELKRKDAVCVGYRVQDAPPDAADRAMRLAAFAIERDVEVIALAEGDTSGLERFGIRTERIAGDTPSARAACEDQIRRFWNIDLVL